jgi:hypothetical protein
MAVRRIAVVIWLLGELASARASERSDPGRSWLDWSSSEAAAGCGDALAFAAQVEQRLGRSLAVAAAELALSISVRIERLPGPSPRWTGEVRVHSRDGAPDGVRTIDRAGESCEPLLATLSLMTALVLQRGENDGPERPAAVERLAAQNRTQVDEPGPQETVVAVQRGRIPPAWMVSVGLGPAIVLGLLPGPSLAGEAAVGLQRGDGMLLVSAALSAKETVFINPTQGATLSRGAVDVAGCWPGLDRDSRTLALCGGAELGRLRAVGFGFDASTTQERWSVGLVADALLRQRLVGPFFAAIGAKLVIPLQRDRIAYTGPTGQVEQIFTTAPVAGSGRLLIGVAFR